VKLLVAVGGFPHSSPTVAFARQLAPGSTASILVLNVVESEELRDRSEETLAAARKELDGLAVETLTRVGAPTEQILSEATSGNYDLLVIGARQKASLSEVLLGSVARKVVSRAPISALVVKGASRQLSRILICTGGKRYADPTVTEGLELAKAAGAEVTLLYVAMQTPTMYAGLREVEQRLTELLQTDTDEARHLRRAAATMKELQVEGSIQLRHGPVVDEILREAALGDYDLIVLGARFKRGPIRDLLWGNVTGGLLDRAKRPVLVAMGSSTGRW